MKRPWRRMFALVVMVGSLNVSAADASDITGRVQRLDVRSSDGLHIVTIEGTPGGRPACAQHQPYFMIKDEHSDVGKAQLAMLLSAFMAGKAVRVTGAGTCTRWLDGEDIEDVILN